MAAASMIPLFCSQPRTFATTHVWSGAGITANWNNGNNWVGGATPTAGETAPVILEFPANINGSVTNNIPGLKVDSLRLLGSGLTINGANDASLTLRGGNVSTNLYSAGVNYLGTSLPLVLEGVVRVESPVLLAIYSGISGSGGLSIAGGVRFDGVAPNTYGGATLVRGGVLTLNRQILIFGGGTFGVVSVPAELIVEAGTVNYSTDAGVADNSLVTLEDNCHLNLNGHDDTIGGLMLAGGDVQTAGGVLTLNGDVTVTENGSAITGKLSLGGSTRTFSVAMNRIGTINAAISGGGGIGQPGLTKTGAGELVLASDNSYPGATAINDGTLEIHSANALGSALFGGVTIASSAVLSLAEGVIVPARPLTLNESKLRATGNASWLGGITLNGDCTAQCSFTGTALALTGVLGGNGNLAHIGSGKLALLGTNANTFTGTLALTDGILELGKSGGNVAISGSLVIGGFFHTNNADYAFLTAPNQIAPNAPVTILGSGLLHLNGQNETLEALVFQGGEVQTGNGTLTVAGPLTVNASSQYARIAGKLALSAGTNSFNVLAGGDGL